MALGKRRKVEDESDVDLTPMLDVVFIMLIFFIVTASFVKESGIDVNRPPAIDQPENPDSPPKNIVFRVTEANEIWVGSRRVDVRSVRALVERNKAEHPEGKVVIQASPKAKTELFVKISDQAREAGVSDISLNTK